MRIAKSKSKPSRPGRKWPAFHTAAMMSPKRQYPPGNSPSVTGVRLEIVARDGSVLYIQIDGEDPHVDELITMLTEMRDARCRWLASVHKDHPHEA